jgi:hypothetical protein
MEKKKGYIVLEVGFEYNDEYYSTGNYGTTYEAPKKVFLNEETAMVELRQKTFEKLRGEDLGRYGGDGLDGICKKGMNDVFSKICQEEFDIDTDEYDIEIPKTATDEQLMKIIECLKLEFFKLVEVDLD